MRVVMPGLNGYEVCERLKSGEATFSIPVLFLTSKSDAGDMLRGYFSGAHEYMVKPFTRDELVTRVNTLLG